MTIEMSPPSIEAKAPTSEAKGNKNPASGSEKLSMAKGFQAILSGLDSSAGAAVSVAATESVEPNQLMPMSPSGLLVAADEKQALPKDESNTDATTLLNQYLQWLSPEAALPGAENKSNQTGSEGILNVPLPVPAVSNGVVLAPPAGPATIRSQPGLQAQVLEGAPDLSPKVIKGKSDLTSTQEMAGSSPLDGNLIAARTTPDVKTQVIQQRMESLQTAPLSVATTANLSAAIGREEFTGTRSIFKSLGSDPPLPQAMTYGSPASMSGAPQPVTLAPQEAYVAEQVKYWISNDVQNAEMKLDGLGDSPVEVSISMHGNEAQVAFRTNELQTREALERASTDLQGLLQREGLVLTGVSVGTAGAGDSGNQNHKSRQGARQALVSAASPLPNGDRSVSKPSSGHALDIFV
jgi:flagellar hook-length control protein FliK